MNLFYPISLNLNGKLCIVIGGGKVATRKIHSLLECGATVKVLSPTIEVKLEHLLQGYPTLSWIKAPYQGKKDLEGACLVFAATHIPSLNEKIFHDSNALGIFANIASDGKLGDFITPATLVQGDLQISVSTSGKVPGLSKLIKENLQDQFIPEYKSLIGILEQVRQAAITNLTPKAENLGILADIIKDYPSILKDLTSGIHPDTITKKLLDKVK